MLSVEFDTGRVYDWGLVVPDWSMLYGSGSVCLVISKDYLHNPLYDLVLLLSVSSFSSRILRISLTLVSRQIGVLSITAKVCP